MNARTNRILLVGMAACVSMGTGPCPCGGDGYDEGTGVEECDESECGQATCEGEAVRHCDCGETMCSNGPCEYRQATRQECATPLAGLVRTCEVVSDGAGGTPVEAVCAERCETAGEIECRTQDGLLREYVCEAYGRSHEPNSSDVRPVVDGADYSAILAWRATTTPCRERACSDESDNDEDGDIDCDDDNCLVDPICQEGDCDDDEDNDGDERTDCQDVDCQADPACIESVCDDGVNNDNDGVTDCRDEDCWDDPACVELVCDDGEDSDEDDWSDCLDADCNVAEVCFNTCPLGDLGSVTGTPAIEGSNRGAANQVTGSCSESIFSGSDVAYQWTAPTTGCYQIDTEGSAELEDTVLMIYDDCDYENELLCNDNSGQSPEGSSYLELSTTQGTAYIIVVDAFAEEGAGLFNLNINAIGAPCP